MVGRSRRVAHLSHFPEAKKVSVILRNLFYIHYQVTSKSLKSEFSSARRQLPVLSLSLSLSLRLSFGHEPHDWVHYVIWYITVNIHLVAGFMSRKIQGAKWDFVSMFPTCSFKICFVMLGFNNTRWGFLKERSDPMKTRSKCPFGTYGANVSSVNFWKCFN